MVQWPNIKIKGQKCRITPSWVLTLNPMFWLVQPGVCEVFGLINNPGKTTLPAMGAFGKFLPNPKLKLREQLTEVCCFRHLSHRTEQVYWHWMKGSAHSGTWT